jgi:hypothetical protein
VSAAPDTGDSSLFDPAGRERPAYRIVRRVLRQQAAKRAARLAQGTSPAPH